MNRESFLETIHAQCSEDILEAYQKSMHKDPYGNHAVDYQELSGELNRLMKMVAKQGVSYTEFAELVYSNLPQASGKLTLKPPRVVAEEEESREAA